MELSTPPAGYGGLGSTAVFDPALLNHNLPLGSTGSSSSDDLCAAPNMFWARTAGYIPPSPESSDLTESIVKTENSGQADAQKWSHSGSPATTASGVTPEDIDPEIVCRGSAPVGSQPRAAEKSSSRGNRRTSSVTSTDIGREKNRLAASKCRKKKKIEERQLEERRRMLQVQNSILHDSAEALRSEVLMLKHEILRHGSCNFAPINSYIAGAAARVG